MLTSLTCSLFLSKTGKTQHHLLQKLWLPCSMLPTPYRTSQDSSSSRLQESVHTLCSCSMLLTHNSIQSHRAFYLLIRPQRGCHRSWICKTCSTFNAQGNKLVLGTIADIASLTYRWSPQECSQIGLCARPSRPVHAQTRSSRCSRGSHCPVPPSPLPGQALSPAGARWERFAFCNRGSFCIAATKTGPDPRLVHAFGCCHCTDLNTTEELWKGVKGPSPLGQRQTQCQPPPHTH